jgi:hypothetical protein
MADISRDASELSGIYTMGVVVGKPYHVRESTIFYNFPQPGEQRVFLLFCVTE